MTRHAEGLIAFLQKGQPSKPPSRLPLFISLEKEAAAYFGMVMDGAMPQENVHKNIK